MNTIKVTTKNLHRGVYLQEVDNNNMIIAIITLPTDKECDITENVKYALDSHFDEDVTIQESIDLNIGDYEGLDFKVDVGDYSHTITIGLINITKA